MKTRIAIAVVLFATGCAQPPESPATTTTDAAATATPGANADHVRTHVNRLFDAMSNAQVEAIDSLTAADIVHVGVTGEALNESQLLDRYRAGNPFKYTVDNIDVRVYGDVAVVNARLSGPGGSGKVHVTQVWVLRRDAPTAAAAPSQRGFVAAGLMPQASMRSDPASSSTPSSDVQSAERSDPAAASRSDPFVNRYQLVSSHSSPAFSDPAM
ncbi:MAG: nuclear transport factor 2 family protein [Longimicrobiales bacterium]